MLSLCPRAPLATHGHYDGSIEGYCGHRMHASKIPQSSFFLDENHFLKTSLFRVAPGEFSMTHAFI